MELERAQARLDNIRSVEPILSALHTISLGSWQAAIRQSAGVQQYKERLTALLPPLLPHLPVARRKKMDAQPARIVALVVGSERGLCGRFNTTVANRAETYLAEQAECGTQVELAALGSRARRLLQRRGHELAWSGTLSITALPSSDLALDLTRRWLARYEAHELDGVDLIHNAYHGVGKYEPTVTRMLPPQLPGGAASGVQDAPQAPVIVETDPLSLYTRVIEQWAAVSLYERLLDSATAEHSARYQLLETATQNADQLIAELTLAIQTARQEAITRETLELAAGAGLIGHPPRKEHR
jgi:F-type H+-transporting ATPase subunit gamma